MKILCAYSSITFTCDHFPGSLTSREACHPIFHMEQRKLFPYLKKWSFSELTPVDSYLLFLALLKSSDLVAFRVPAVITPKTHQIVANNMEYLATTLARINAISTPAFALPHYVITPETKELSTVHYWLENWNNSYQDFRAGKVRDYDNRKLVQREAALQRLIKNPHRSLASYAVQLSDWAADAADFPTFNTISGLTNKPCTLREYWKELIIKACQDQIYFLSKKDLLELQEHCYDQIIGSEGKQGQVPGASLQSHLLFKVINNAIEKKTNFLGFGDVDLPTTIYEVFNPLDSVEDANLLAMAQSAPDHLPKREEYPSWTAWAKAKLRYDQAQKLAKRAAKNSPPEGDTNV